MKRLMIIPLAALAIALAPLGFQPRADDAHHPSEAAKAGNRTGVKAKKTKTPAQKPKKTSLAESMTRLG